MIVVSALYKFCDLPDRDHVKECLKQLCSSLDIRGTLLVAYEGVNGTVAGSRASIDHLKTFFQKDRRFDDMEYKESFAPKSPFYRLKVRLKKEIVTFGQPEANPSRCVGTYVAPKDWNNLLSDPEVILLDTRNDYEYDIGTFQNAINPQTHSFREFPKYVQENLDPQKHKKIAMFCTGGIRCEKASSYMLTQGFQEVYHLKGGILKYLEEVDSSNSLWKGDCFVFDQRVSLRDGLDIGDYGLCYGCRRPISSDAKESPLYQEGVSCPACHAELTPKREKRRSHRQKQMTLAKQRGEAHLGH